MLPSISLKGILYTMHLISRYSSYPMGFPRNIIYGSNGGDVLSDLSLLNTVVETNNFQHFSPVEYKLIIAQNPIWNHVGKSIRK